MRHNRRTCDIRPGVEHPRTFYVFRFSLRLQFFDARNWDNRIYCYEYDVLYAYSIPAVYGLGGRAFLCLRWQILPQLTLYFRASETLYAKSWATTHGRPQTRTDLHLLFRVTL